MSISSARMLTVCTGLVGILVLARDSRAQVCNSVGPDVIVASLTGPANYPSAGTVGAEIEALAIGTTSCNIGDASLKWIAGTNEHPVIGGALYKLKLQPNGTYRMEQIGQSWLKHGFFALNSVLCCPSCSFTDGLSLGVGCSDPYDASRNGTQGGLGPKGEVNPHKGYFPYPPANPGWSGSTARRCQVAVADLEPAIIGFGGTRFFAEAMYVTADDADAGNQNNNASYREVGVSGSGTAWNFIFDFGFSTVRMQSAIEAWRNVDEEVNQTVIQIPNEGKLILAWQVSPLSSGVYHYEYALYNMNSHDSIGAFSLPVDDDVPMVNEGFHDVDYKNGDGNVPGTNYSGTDWTRTRASGVLSWATESFGANPNANALRWGTTYNFRFDASAPPVAGRITLGRYRSGLDIKVEAQVPGPLVAPGEKYCFGDGADPVVTASCPCGNFGDPGRGCANSNGALGGSLLDAVGTVSPNTLVFTADGIPNGNLSVFLRSTTSNPTGAVFGDGVACIGGSLIRFGAQTSGPAGGNAANSVSAAPITVAAGNTRYYQVQYRNPTAFCTVDTFNASNAYTIVW